MNPGPDPIDRVNCIELGPMDHTETRPGIDRSSDLHRARPHGSHRNHGPDPIHRVTCIELGPQRIATATRPGVCRSMYRDCKTGGVLLHDVPRLQNRRLCVDRSMELQPGPESMITPKPRPAADPSSELHRVPAPWITPKPRSAADRNCNPARCVSLDESRPGSDPSSDLHRVPARSGSKLQNRSQSLRNQWKGKYSDSVSDSDSNSISISGAHFVRRLADVLRTFQRFSLAPGGRSPRRGTIDRFFCASNPE